MSSKNDDDTTTTCHCWGQQKTLLTELSSSVRPGPCGFVSRLPSTKSRTTESTKFTEYMSEKKCQGNSTRRNAKRKGEASTPLSVLKDFALPLAASASSATSPHVEPGPSVGATPSPEPPESFSALQCLRMPLYRYQLIDSFFQHVLHAPNLNRLAGCGVQESRVAMPHLANIQLSAPAIVQVLHARLLWHKPGGQARKHQTCF